MNVASRSVPGGWGRLGEALIRLFMRRAAVVSSEPVSPGFQVITLESPQFRTVAWTAGQKLQITIGSALSVHLLKVTEAV